jgi:hypothetical protein
MNVKRYLLILALLALAVPATAADHTLTSGTTTAWSSLSPAAGDNIYLNGGTLSLDGADASTYTCGSIKATASNGSTITAGEITLTNATSTISAGTLQSGSAALIKPVAGKTLTLNAVCVPTTASVYTVDATGGTVAFNGDPNLSVIEHTGAGMFRCTGGSHAINLTGTVSNIKCFLFINTGGTVNCSGGTLVGNGTSGGEIFYSNNAKSVTTINSTLYSKNIRDAFRFYAGTINWTGSHAISAGSACMVTFIGSGSTLNFHGLSLSVSGALVVNNGPGGTVTNGTGSMVLATSAAQIAGYRCSLPIVGPTLPTVDKVIAPTTYGYVNSLTGTASASVGTPPSMSMFSVEPFSIAAIGGAMSQLGINVAGGLLVMAGGCWMFSRFILPKLRRKKRKPKWTRDMFSGWGEITDTEQTKVLG